MRLLADECVPGPVVRRLRADGHEVAWITDDEPSLGDDVILQRALRVGVPVLTQDNDFGQLVFAGSAKSAGVILMRLHGLRTATRAEIVAAFLRDHEDDIAGHFIVLAPGRIRIRGI